MGKQAAEAAPTTQRIHPLTRDFLNRTDATQPPSMAPSPSGCSRNKKIPTSTDRGAGRR